LLKARRKTANSLLPPLIEQTNESINKSEDAIDYTTTTTDTQLLWSAKLE